MMEGKRKSNSSMSANESEIDELTIMMVEADKRLRMSVRTNVVSVLVNLVYLACMSKTGFPSSQV
jgi:hypothetical protein